MTMRTARLDELAARLRLIVITDVELARPRTVIDVVRTAVRAGAPAVQLRDKAASARELYETGQALLPIARDAGALFFVNDRVDVALALGADGVHVGPDDVPVAGVRAAVARVRGSDGERTRADAGSGVRSGDSRLRSGGFGVRSGGSGGTREGAALPFLVGTSTDDPDVARRLVAEGADYIGCGTVYGTSTKPDAGEVIGLQGLQRVAEAVVDVPVVGIGGIDAERSAEVAAHTSATGVGVVGAVMGAEDVGAAVEAILAPWDTERRSPSRTRRP